MTVLPQKSCYLSPDDLIDRLRGFSLLEEFWRGHAPSVIFRRYPCRENPVYEIQLAWDLGLRFETYAWLWVDALEGRVLQMHSEGV